MPRGTRGSGGGSHCSKAEELCEQKAEIRQNGGGGRLQNTPTPQGKRKRKAGTSEVAAKELKAAAILSLGLFVQLGSFISCAGCSNPAQYEGTAGRAHLAICASGGTVQRQSGIPGDDTGTSTFWGHGQERPLALLFHSEKRNSKSAPSFCLCGNLLWEIGTHPLGQHRTFSSLPFLGRGAPVWADLTFPKSDIVAYPPIEHETLSGKAIPVGRQFHP